MRLLGDPVAPECLPTTTPTTTSTTEAATMVPQQTSSSALLSHHHHLQTHHSSDVHLVDGVTMETLIAVVTGALVVLTILVIIIVALVVRKQNYLKKCSRSEDYILHSEEPILPPNIPVPPPMPPSPLYNPEEYKNSTKGDVPMMTSIPLGNPVWLDEIQSNPLFSRQKHKFRESGALAEEAIPLRSISGEKYFKALAIKVYFKSLIANTSNFAV